MGRIINITSKLDREERFIQIEQKMYKVDCTKNTVLKFMELEERSASGEVKEKDVLDEGIKLFLGTKAFHEIDKENPEFHWSDWQVIFFGVLASALDKDYDEVVNSFRKSTQK